MTAPLAGVIHAAGVLDDGILRLQTIERFEKVFAAKVLGAWNLHTLTKQMPLAFFMLFSSTASLFGSPGQANYAAANAFMDGLAHHRHAQGLPALSINWGAWSELGMAAKQQVVQRGGMGLIPPQQALQVVESLLRGSHVQVGVVPINWSLLANTVGIDSTSFLAEMMPNTSALPVGEFRKELEAVPMSERRALLEDHLRAQIADILGWSPESISLEQGFFDLGMDSLASVALRNRVQSSLGVTLSATLLFTYSTLEALIDYLAEEVLGITADEALDDESEEMLLDMLSDMEEEEDDEVAARRLADQLGLDWEELDE